MTSRKRILFVCTFPPDRFHLGGGAWANSRLIEELGQDADVTVLNIVAPTPNEPEIPLEVRKSRVAATRTILRMIARRQPYLDAKFQWHPTWQRAVAEFARAAGEHDIIVTSEWPALRAASKAGIRPDLHIAYNVDSVLSERFDPAIFRLLGNASRMRLAEHRLMTWPHRVAALSLTDLERLRSWGVYGEHLEIVRPPTVPRPSHGIRRVGIIGKMSWPPNGQAVDELLDVVLPKAQALGLDLEVVLAGDGSERYARRAHVKALGIVEQVDEFYDEIDAVVMPRNGLVTGVSIKVAEAFERGVRVIVPRAIARDLALEMAVSIAETADEVAAELVSPPTQPPRLDDGRSERRGRIGAMLEAHSRQGGPLTLPFSLETLRVVVSRRAIHDAGQILDWLLDAKASGGRRLSTLNLQHLQLAETQPNFHQALIDADAFSADGWPVVSWLRRAGIDVERAGGADVVPLLMAEPRVSGRRFGVIGGSVASYESFRSAIEALGGSVSVGEAGPRSDWDPSAIAARLIAADVEIALISAPLPTGEMIARALIDAGFGGTTMNVGAGLAMATGEIRRAPQAIRALRVEWLYRLVLSPRRMARRYLIEGIPAYFRHANRR